MSETKFYTVIELAEKVGVPRTTINDWLGKYSTYIDYAMQGKRRVYSENTLQILLNVSKMREGGMSSFDIEKKLAETCAVHPEPEPETPAAAPEPSSAEPASGEGLVPVTNQNDSEAYALIAQQQTEEITNLLGERFRDILSKMDSMEDKAHKNAVRAWFFFALTSILIILLCIGGYFAWQFAHDMEQASLRKDHSIEELQTNTAKLQEHSANLTTQMQDLLNEIPEQKKAFDKALQENKANYEKRHEAELAAEREKFAAEQLVKLKEMETLNLKIQNAEQQKAAKEQEIKALNAQIQNAEQQKIAQEKEMKALRDEMKKQQAADKKQQEAILKEIAELRKQAESARNERKEMSREPVKKPVTSPEEPNNAAQK